MKLKGWKILTTLGIVAILFAAGFFFVGNAFGRQALLDETIVQQFVQLKTEQDEEYQNTREQLDSAHKELDGKEKEVKEKQQIIDEANKLQGEIDGLKKEKDGLAAELKTQQTELDSVNSQITEKQAELDKLTGQVDEEKQKPITLTAGTYRVDQDFPSGTYDIELVSGMGNFFSNDLNEIFSTRSIGIQTYKNAYFGYGDELELSGSLKLNFIRKGD